VQNFNRVWHEEENKLASNLNELDVLTKRYMESLSKGKTPKQFEDEFMKWLSANASSDDVTQLAAGIIFNNCASGKYNLANSIYCGSIMGEAMETELKSWAEMAKEELIDQIMSELSEKFNEAMRSIAVESEKGEELCRCGAGASVNAGAKYGPTTLEELVLALGPDIATSALFESALGSPPVGLVLSIPGVTQVQYYYKGLINGPENRSFEIKGNLTGDKMYLQLNGDVKDGDKNLTIEYMVNYKKENAQFPCWTPFLDDGADVFSEGYETVYEVKEIIEKKFFKDEKTGQMVTIDIPRKETKTKKIFRDSPFATFHESGVHRNNKSMWHEYEYFWNAHKLTEPKDIESEKSDEQNKAQKKEIEDRTKEIEQTGKTSFDIEFEAGKESVTQNSEAQIKIITKVIENFPQNNFLIAVLSDSLSNKKLAEQRANFIVSNLISNGISGNRLTALGSDKKTTGDLKKKKLKHTKVDLVKK
jgi:outer membrane protein OmpA-like peptidoglycan-associated protein